MLHKIGSRLLSLLSLSAFVWFPRFHVLHVNIFACFAVCFMLDVFLASPRSPGLLVVVVCSNARVLLEWDILLFYVFVI